VTAAVVPGTDPDAARRELAAAVADAPDELPRRADLVLLANLDASELECELEEFRRIDPHTPEDEQAVRRVEQRHPKP
jgi:hypothetical protein